MNVRRRIEEDMRGNNESWSDIIAATKIDGIESMDRDKVPGFRVWTEKFVYFPIYKKGNFLWARSVPRDPVKECC
jgi:hypothetical protein